MTKPIPDKAEVALEFPEKFYIGTFERSSKFDARFDADGIQLLLDRPGDAETRKSVHLHVYHELFADILSELAGAAAKMPLRLAPYRDQLRDAAKALYQALSRDPDLDDAPGLSEEEGEQILRLME